MLADFDADPVAALSAAMRVVLDMPDGEWAELLLAAPIDAARRGLLLDNDEPALDQLAAELNERRSFAAR